MQQLETYKLKHIGHDDAFGPDALNANTDAIAEQLTRLDTALDTKAAQAALETLTQTVAAKGNCRIITGTYKGKGGYGGTKNTITFDGNPLLVAVHGQSTSFFAMPPCIRTFVNMASEGMYSSVETTWGENSLTWYGYKSDEAQLNVSNQTYRYIVLLEA